MSWRASIAKAEAALRRYHDSFVWRSLAVERFVNELIASGRILEPKFPAPNRRGDEAFEFEDPRTGEALLDGLVHPGL